MASVPAVERRPSQRGMLCVYGFFAALFGGIGWMLMVPAARAWPVVAFALSVTSLMGTSALYHRVEWSRAWYERVRRLDHAMIFVLITGTELPLFLIALEGRGAEPYFAFALAAAAAGFLITMLWAGAPKWVRAVVYIAVGWSSLPVIGHLADALGGTALGLLLLGGGLYSVGGVAYGMKWPNPVPDHFGYHEVFHAFVLAAVACHYAVVAFWVV